MKKSTIRCLRRSSLHSDWNDSLSIANSCHANGPCQARGRHPRVMETVLEYSSSSVPMAMFVPGIIKELAKSIFGEDVDLQPDPKTTSLFRMFSQRLTKSGSFSSGELHSAPCHLEDCYSEHHNAQTIPSTDVHQPDKLDMVEQCLMGISSNAVDSARPTQSFPETCAQQHSFSDSEFAEQRHVFVYFFREDIFHASANAVKENSSLLNEQNQSSVKNFRMEKTRWLSNCTGQEFMPGSDVSDQKVRSVEKSDDLTLCSSEHTLADPVYLRTLQMVASNVNVESSVSGRKNRKVELGQVGTSGAPDNLFQQQNVKQHYTQPDGAGSGMCQSANHCHGLTIDTGAKAGQRTCAVGLTVLHSTQQGNLLVLNSTPNKGGLNPVIEIGMSEMSEFSSFDRSVSLSAAQESIHHQPMINSMCPVGTGRHFAEQPQATSASVLKRRQRLHAKGSCADAFERELYSILFWQNDEQKSKKQFILCWSC